VPNFVSVATSIAELARREKLCTQSLSHSPSLFDAWEPKFLHWNKWYDGHPLCMYSVRSYSSRCDSRLPCRHSEQCRPVSLTCTALSRPWCDLGLGGGRQEETDGQVVIACWHLDGRQLWHQEQTVECLQSQWCMPPIIISDMSFNVLASKTPCLHRCKLMISQ